MEKFILNVRPSNSNGKDYILPKDHPVLLNLNGLASATVDNTYFSRRNETIHPIMQGHVSSCVGESGKVVLTDCSKYKNDDLSGMWIYKKAKLYDDLAGENYEGTTISGACEALRQVGCCLEKFYPYNQSTEDYLPLSGADDDATSRKIFSYYFIPLSGDDRIEDVKTILKTQCLWTSFNVYKSFYDVKSDGMVVEDGFISSGIVGGHAVCLTGYKYINNVLYWEFQNSWGDTWGDKGFFYMSHSLFKKVCTAGAYYLQIDQIPTIDSTITNKPTTTSTPSSSVNKMLLYAGIPCGIILLLAAGFAIYHYLF